MDEARAVLARLERIERLEHIGAPAPDLLEEVRSLLREAEAWVRAEPAETDRAQAALAASHAALLEGALAGRGPSRTLVA
jgi:hypothetical protein